MNLLETKEISLTTQAGVVKTFLLSKFPAVAGREIISKYPLSNIPKLGEYQQSEETMLKLMSYVAVVTDDGAQIRLSTRALVDNHAADWETLAKLEWAQLEYNVSFFGKGGSSDFFENLSKQAATWISQTLIPLLAQSSQAAKQRSEN